MTNKQGPEFLIIGLERCGTHWVTPLLNAHPEIACFPDFTFRFENGRHNKVGEVHLFDTLAGLTPGNEGRFARPFTDFLTKYNKVFADLVPLADKISRDELYGKFKERYIEYCEEQRQGKRLWATVQALSAFGLALVPLIAIGQFPGSLNLYAKTQHTLFGAGFIEEYGRSAALAGRFFPGGEQAWKYILFALGLLILIVFSNVVHKDRNLRPYGVAAGIALAGTIFFGLELWVLFLPVGFGLALRYGRERQRSAAKIVVHLRLCERQAK